MKSLLDIKALRAEVWAVSPLGLSPKGSKWMLLREVLIKALDARFPRTFSCAQEPIAPLVVPLYVTRNCLSLSVPMRIAVPQAVSLFSSN